ncbi:helix-turn-helix transcriptional regulator [Streptococcus suis]|uniref:helix-turn-helix transcriptional regulator n=1 Tax=Streptococcus suis TaxID=1307 RepID=UPI0006B52F20|nr:helix-turn-helix transcriptional regulator [Streptococcus suis]ASW51312.1 transcriptional regulator [Streptococcus suis]KPA70230.1 XRE family transcriptional regulator [Streptococcus suis]
MVKIANIITNLKEYRKAKKISQQELAQLVGVRRETIVHLENNRYNPSLEMALKIAEIFDCHVEELFQLKKKAEND